jgi:hypothetical protein
MFMGMTVHPLRWVFSTLIILVLTAPWNAGAQERSYSEYEVKAAFIYSFVKFIDWPEKSLASSKAITTFCVIGRAPFGGALDEIQGRVVRGKSLEVQHISSLRDLKECQVLFISSSERERLPKIVEAAKEANILTVGDSAGVGKQGVMINLFVLEKKVKFEVNVERARQARLIVSSKLLKLAQTLYDE